MTAWLPASLKGPSGLLKAPPNYHLPCRGHGGMCFKMDLRCDSHSHSARLSLSLSLPRLSLSPFFLLSSCSFLSNGSHMSGKGLWHRGDHVRSGRAASPPGSDRNVLLTVHSPDCVPAHLSKPHHHQQPGPGDTGGRGGGVSAASRCRYCSNASTFETEPPETSSNCQSEDLSLAPVGL